MPADSQPAYEFEGFFLDASQLVLRRGSAEIKLSPKGFAALHYFVTHPGQVISRDELQAAVWPGQHLSPNGIDQKIAEIRKRLAEAGAPADVIQNRHGRGWCFTASVAETTEPAPAPTPVPAPALAASPSAGSHRLWPALAAAALLAAIAFLTASALARLPAEPRILGYRPLTDDGLRKDPPLVTDGSLVYFRESASLASPSRASSVPLAGGQSSPAVLPLPNGFPIAFMPSTRSLVLTDNALPPHPLLYWNPSSGTARPASFLSDGNSDISPDGRAVAYLNAGFLLIQSRGSREPLRVPVSGARSPRWSPDGRRIRFSIRDPKTFRETIWEVARDGHNPRYLPLDRPGDPYGVCCGVWTHDGRYFVFSDLGPDEQTANIWAVRDGSPPSRPIRLTNTPIRFSEPVPTLDGSALLAIGTIVRGETARFDSRSRQWLPFWDGIPAIDISFTRDARRAAFCRYPEHTLWVSDADGANRHQLTEPPFEAFQPHWSPDGRRIAFMGHRTGEPWRAYLIAASGGSPEPAKPDAPLDQGVPSWSADGRYLVYGEPRVGQPPASMAIRVLDLRDRSVALLPGSAGKWSPRWSPDGRYILAASADMGALWLYSISARAWTRLATMPYIDNAEFSLDSRYIYFTGGTGIFRLRLSDRRLEDLTGIPDVAVTWSAPAPDGSLLVLRAVRHQEIYALDWKLP